MLRAEELANTDPDMDIFVSDIHWLAHPLPRLIMALAEAVEAGVEGAETNVINVVRAAIVCFGDEQVP